MAQVLAAFEIGGIMKFNYEKKSYKAKCIQYDGTNYQAIYDLMYGEDVDIREFRGFVQIRFLKPLKCQKVIDNIEVGMWVVVRENENKVIYTDEQFKIKYKEIE